LTTIATPLAALLIAVVVVCVNAPSSSMLNCVRCDCPCPFDFDDGQELMGRCDIDRRAAGVCGDRIVEHPSKALFAVFELVTTSVRSETASIIVAVPARNTSSVRETSSSSVFSSSRCCCGEAISE